MVIDGTNIDWQYIREEKKLVILGGPVLPNFITGIDWTPELLIGGFGKEEWKKVVPWGAYLDGIEVIQANDLFEISPSAFAWMPNLEKAEVKEARIIGNTAFSNCPKLKWVLMDNAQVVGNGAFSGCRSLVSTSEDGNRMELRNVRIVSAHAFMNCRSIKTVTFKKKGTRTNAEGNIIQEAGSFLEYIGEAAFFSCLELKNVYMGGKDSEGSIGIGEHAFYKTPYAEKGEE